MPELPEVETVRRDLCRAVCGAEVVRVEIRQPEMLVGTTAEDLRAATEGARIEDIRRRGKALIVDFSSGHSLIVHFRMTGQLYPVAGDAHLPTHTRTVFHLDDGRLLIHVDVRRLGTLELAWTSELGSAATLAGIGRDALDDPLTTGELQALLAGRTCAVKVFLLDQKRLSGIGNIYACEILARCGIAPDTPCADLSRDDVKRLHETMRRVLREAVQARGTTITDYVTGTGEPGGFQHHLRTYGREGEVCARRGCRGIIERMVQAQRSTFYCPDCQGLHRGGKPE